MKLLKVLMVTSLLNTVLFLYKAVAEGKIGIFNVTCEAIAFLFILLGDRLAMDCF
jgi:hypothetical protein